MRGTSRPIAESEEQPENRGHHASRPPVFAFTIREAAEVAKISRSTLYKYIRSGALPAKKCGARTLILFDDLIAFLRNLPSLQVRSMDSGGDR
jgi:excisionase family DNA binding protein